MEKSIKAQVEYYLKLPYTMEVQFQDEQGGYYVATYKELPDLTMTGSTPEEAIRELLIEAPEWFELNIKSGYKIPLPAKPSMYSGRVNFRMPRNLHAKVAAIAAQEGVSLNQYLLSAVAQSVGKYGNGDLVIKRELPADNDKEVNRALQASEPRKSWNTHLNSGKKQTLPKNV
jgi:predicted RNase H-like HicB family nuclease